MQDVVFTALFGGYETLNEIKHLREPGTRYVCFTDSKSLESNTWEIFRVEPTNLESGVRASRAIKMFGHRYFEDGTRSLYIDNSVQLKVDGRYLLDEFLKSNDLTFLSHTKRKSVANEFFICAAYGLEDQSILSLQYKKYLQIHPEVLREKPYWGGMIARRNCDSVDYFMETWNEQYLTFSKRDQLSINISAHLSGTTINRIELNNAQSEWHAWPVINNRRLEMRDTTSMSSHRRAKIIWNSVIYGPRYITRTPSWLLGSR